MALQKSKIAIPLTEGINTKVDPNQTAIGTLENLENAVMDEPGRIKKRTGYTKVDTLLLDDTEVTDTQRITNYKDELCLFNNTNFYSFSENTNRWTNKGTVSNIFPTSTSIIRNTYQQSNIDSAFISGLNVYAWEDSRNGIRTSIIDSSTGNELLSDTEITSTGIKPKVEFIGNIVYIIFIDGSDIKYRTINPIRPNVINAEVTLVSADVNASNKTYDTTSKDNKIFICWNSSTATLRIKYISENETTSSTIEEAAESPTTAIGLHTDENSRILISYYNGTAVKMLIKNFTLTTNLLTATSIETIANITNVSIGSSSTSSTYSVLYEQSAAATKNHLIRKNTVTLAGSVGTPADFIRSCGLISKQFKQSDNYYTAIIHNSTLQSTIFIVNEDAEIVSKISQGVAGTLQSSGHLTNVSTLNDTTHMIASQIKGRTISEDNTLFSLLGVISTTLDFNIDSKFDNAKLGEQLHTNGGMIQSYDGKEIVEHGFHVFPEDLINDSTATTGGSISDGVYQYSAIYSWTDNKGQQHRSAPSIALDVTLSGGTSTQTQTITVPTLRITEKSNVVIELYRTEDSGTIFYKTTSVSAAVYNDETTDTINIVDTLSDIDLIDNELLYTTGGVLENIAPPAASIIETFGGRIFLAGLEDENKIQFSKIRQEGSPVEFNDSQIINVNPTGGKIVSLAAMDDKLIIFKETSIFYISGDGPNNLGLQDNFISPELISSDVGCKNQKSVVLTPQGLMFKSKKGIYTLTKSLTTEYTGAFVEDYNSSTIKSANLISTKNIVIFLTDSKALVFDYFVGKWITYTNHVGISATSLNDNYYYVRSNNEVYKESSNFTDNGSFIPLKLQTSWISFVGIQAYQRVYRMVILGEYKSKHKLIIKAAYNFLNAYTQQKVVDTADFTSDTTYGSESPYGTGTPYGGTGNKYQIRMNMKTQKCESIKISIEDSQSSSFGEGLQLSNLLFVVGAKRGDFKVSQSTTYGTN
jgi:hypothetical protein